MKRTTDKRTLFLCVCLISIAVLSRILNAEMQWYHFGPLVAISLFSGALMKNRAAAFLIPLSAYLLSDVVLEMTSGTGFYGLSQFFVYGGMAMVVLLGSVMKRINVQRVVGMTISGSLLFWLVSNLGVFVSGYYGISVSGLITTYLLALPFYTQDGTALFFNQLVGDLLFSGALFGVYALSQRGFLRKEKAF